MSNRTPTTSPMSRPLSNVRRDPVNGDPLFDPLQSSITPNDSPFRSSEPLRSVDVTETMADQILAMTKISPIDPNTLTTDIPGLIEVFKNGHWLYVVKISQDLLNTHHYEDHTLRHFIYSLRFEGLFRMKLYDELTTEINLLLTHQPSFDQIDNIQILQLEHYLSLRLLLSEVKVMTGHSQEAIEEYLSLQHWLTSLSSFYPNESMYYHYHISCHLINTYIRNRNWKYAIRLLRDLSITVQQLIQTKLQPQQASQSQEQPQEQEQSQETNEKKDKETTKEHDMILKIYIILLARMSKLLLQIGAMKPAIIHYEHASNLLIQYPQLGIDDQYIQSILILGQGLIQFSEEKFEQALDTFGTLIESLRIQPIIHTSPSTTNIPSQFTTGLILTHIFYQSKDENLLASSINNYAITSLYLKKTNQAIQLLEKIIGEHPLMYMTDCVVFNLCTMYDLYFAPEMSQLKKKTLQKIAIRYDLQDPILHWRSFRLNTTN